MKNPRWQANASEGLSVSSESECYSRSMLQLEILNVLMSGPDNVAGISKSLNNAWQSSLFPGRII